MSAAPDYSQIDWEKEKAELFKLSLDMTCLAGFDGYFKQINSSWTKVLGWSKTELQSKPFIEFVHPDDKQATIEEAKKISLGEKISGFENRYQTKSGSYKWLSWIASVNKEKQLIYAIAKDITKTKLAQEELTEKEAQLRYLQESNPAILYISNLKKQHSLTFMSKNVQELVGYKYDDILKSESFWYDNIHPLDQERVRDSFKDLQKKDEIEIEYRFQKKDKSFIWVRDLLRLVRDEKGKPLELVGSWIDVTQKRKFEKELQEKNYFVHKVTSHLPHIIYIYDLTNFNMVFSNKSWWSFLGYKEKNTGQENVSDFMKLVHPEDLSRAQEHVQNFSDQKKDQVVDLSVRLKSARGKWKHLLIKERVFMRDNSGNPLQILGSAEDITELRLAQHEVKESEERLRQVADNVDEILWLRENDEILYVNNAYERIYGRSVDSLKKNPDSFIDVIHPEDKPVFFEAAEIFQETGEFAIDYRIIKPDKTITTVRAITFPIYNEAGEMYRVAGIVQDISAQKDAEKELNKHLDTLQRFKQSTVGLALDMKKLEKQNKTLKAKLAKNKLKKKRKK